jgi:EAL domain-containing protein (putative c-di-GMP-specific phosphodiesterase class I)
MAERASETTRTLVALDCKLAIDDFGAGYSLLARPSRSIAEDRPQLRRRP